MTLFDKCPGAANIRSPTIILKKCPNCGEEVELFSDEMQVKCDNCGFTVYNNIESCVQWCEYARECVGDELYKKLKRKK
jgi:ribosomal protein S27AE